jgi:hypothetical protein
MEDYLLLIKMEELLSLTGLDKNQTLEFRENMEELLSLTGLNIEEFLSIPDLHMKIYTLLNRLIELPPYIDNSETREYIVSTWTRDNILADINNKHQEYINTPTQNKNNIIKASETVSNYLSIDIVPYVLEINAGNCVASKIFKDILIIKFPNINWISTDIITYSSRLSEIPFEELDQIQAVHKFGSISNILLVISPIPCSYNIDDTKGLIGYGDYYACYDFINGAKIEEIKYIIYIGGLGTTDGSPGTYKYLIKHPQLKLEKRIMLESRQIIIDEYGASLFEKELFIFKIYKT